MPKANTTLVPAPRNGTPEHQPENPRYWHRTPGTYEIHVGATGHTHTTVAHDPIRPGEQRLYIDCPACLPYLHPVDFSRQARDVIPTATEREEQRLAEHEQNRLSPEIAAVIARVVSEMRSGRTQQQHPQEDAIVAAVRAELAKQAGTS